MVTLITGASTGIGAEFARQFAALGHDLVVVARSADRLEELAARLRVAHRVDVSVIVMDLSTPTAAAELWERTTELGIEVDMLVNNAGFSIAQSFAAVPWSRQQDFLMTLVVNACGLAHGVIAGMRERGQGRIVNVASLAGFAPGVAGHTLYPGAKSLMIKFSQALDAEYRASGLKITAVCPGFTRTEFADANGTAAVMNEAPRRLFQTPEQVVTAALKANDRGKVVVVPGWHNLVAAIVLQHLPQSFVRAALMKGSAKYHLD